MLDLTRRSFIAVTGLTAACTGTGINSSRDQIETDVQAARNEMFRSVPGTQQLSERAAGVLIIPAVREAGFMVGGAYGEGALLIGNAPVDYFSLTSASFGIQVGVQRYSHALFFMTQESLAGFRYADGWQLGIDAEFVTPDSSASYGISTNTINLPVYAVVFDQAGLTIGATLAGGKYSRLSR